MKIVDSMAEVRDEIRALNQKVGKIKQEQYAEIYNNGDVKYFEEIQGHLAMSSAAVSTFVESLENSTEHKKRFAQLDTSVEP